MDNFTRAMAALGKNRTLGDARLGQIVADMRGRDVHRASRNLEAYLAEKPRDPDALFLMARLLYWQDRREESLEHLKRCLDVAPDFTVARYEYANQLSEMNRYAAALAELGQLLAEDPANPLFREVKAGILKSIGDNADALALYEALAKENPDRADCWLNYGDALRIAGASRESIDAYRRAITVRASCGQAYRSLADLKTFRFDPAEIAAMRERAVRADLSPDDRAGFQFALGKAYEDLGDYQRSWEQYAAVNAALRAQSNYNPDALRVVARATKALFTPAFFDRRAGWGNQAADPIFVLGRPRSGSTLIEQILASHSAIEGTSELPYIANIVRRLARRQGLGVALDPDALTALTALNERDVAALGQEYLTCAGAHRKIGRPYFIDKRPDNYLFTGMIHLILPRAKIIDVRRNPADSSLSIFKGYSGGGRLRITELGGVWREYAGLMAHFDRVLPGKVHRVIYENLVENPESEIRRLFDYLELPFEERTLRFHETKRPVATPSSEQVRRPITKDAIDHWRHFEPWLGPLIQSLGPTLTSYPAVPDALR